MLLNEEVKWRDVFRVVPGILICCWFASADFAWSQLVRTYVGTDLAVDGPGWFVVRDPLSNQVFVTQRGDFHLDSAGSTFVGGQVLLQAFNDPSLLVPSGGGLYTNLALAGPRSSPGAPGTAGLGCLRDGALEIEWVPDPLIPLSRHGVRLLITGEARHRWTIEASSDLLTWQVLMDQTNPPDELEVVDTACRAYGRRFYRVLVDRPPSLLIGQSCLAPNRTQ